MKKIIALNIYLDEETKQIKAELKHRCETKQIALSVIQEFVNRKGREKKSDA